MSNVSLDANSEGSATFLDLLTVIGNEIPEDALFKLKFLLRGHVDKDVLDYIESGAQLLLVLNKRGLVTNKRLSFLRKFLKEAKCTTSLKYLDIYEDENKPWGEEGRLRTAVLHDNRKRRLENLAKRIENEIHLSNENLENSKQDIVGLRNEIQKKKELIIGHEENVQKSKLSIVSEQLLLQSVRKKLEDLKYVIRKLYREEEDLTEKLNNNIKPNLKRTIRDALASKRVEIKGKELFESELSRKYERITEQIRLLNTDVRHQTNEIIEIEQKIQEDTFNVRQLTKDVSKQVTSSKELKETLTELKQSQDDTTSWLFPTHPYGCHQDKRLTFTSPSTDHSINTSSTTSVSKMIDYDELVEHSELLMIGRYGTHENSPQFMHPSSIAIDVNDEIYVADTKNARVQILSLNGIPVRKPIDLGKNFQPSSIAVNSARHIFVSDSHIVRGYSSNGELLRYILPIYGKTDVRPQITGLATTNDGAILLVDRANKQIQRFRQDGTFQRFVGGNHTFQLPFGVTVTKNGDIVVSDSCQMTILDGGNEEVKSTYGTRGIGKGKFLNPRGLTVDIDNNIIVADCESHQIHVLNVENEQESLFGSLGTDAGFFDTPCDVAVSSDGRKIVVVEARNHRLQIFTRPHQDCNYEKYMRSVTLY